MPDDFSGIDLNAIADRAAQQTDAQLIGKISSLTRLTDAEIAELCPQTSDAKQLVELMAIVRSSQNENEKISQIISNSERFAGTILKLLAKFV